MKLITKEIEKRLEKYPLYSQDGKSEEAVAVAKFFLCSGAWTWFIIEADLERDTLYGIVINAIGEVEYSYFSLHEMENFKTALGLKIERDLSFKPTKLKDVANKFLKAFLGV